MKKLIVLTIAIIFAIGAQAQSKQSPTAGTPNGTPTVAGTTTVGTANQCVATLAGGKMWTPGTGVNIAMIKPMTFPNGTTVNPDGSYVTKDKKTGQLKNNDCFDAKGNITKAPPPPPGDPTQPK